MATAIAIKQLLEERGVPFTERHHPETYTAQMLAETDRISGHHVAKVVVVVADGRPVELVLPASRRVNLNRVRTLLGADTVRLATEEELAHYFPEFEPGAIPPFRVAVAEVIMDPSLHAARRLLLGAGTRRDAILMDFEDWLRIVNPLVGTFAEA